MAGYGIAADQEKGTAEDAKALVKKAVAYMKEVGKEKALVEFNDPKGKFIEKDLYVWATGLDGTNLSHPFTPALIGKNMMELKDADGKPFVKERIDIVKAKGSGTIQYRWTNPQTKKVEKKEAYFEAVPGTDLFINCGYYM
ncbi:MAG: cache domain-containing protein [Deltaproteobacteria bacterium]|nr:cache domain-containing protein [Deltaproteobacteria bacterium]